MPTREGVSPGQGAGLAPATNSPPIVTTFDKFTFNRPVSLATAPLSEEPPQSLLCFSLGQNWSVDASPTPRGS